ncbi:MAG: hypothetical protein GEU86_20445, partial [Actinophytocola sp.]|nr:hypothetical protein [Actinophytocola sp.]
MHNWAKRGLQTALVTGGMLMLGTGIASAQENVDPDRPASPIDGSLTVPVDISNNAVGAPDGQHDVPEHQAEYSTKQVTDPIKEQVEENLPEDDPFRGNQVEADVVAPVQVTNNAVGVLGDAEVEGGGSSQSYDGSSDIDTSGEDASLAGNVVDLDWAAPIQIANNAAALGGDASSTGNSAEQDTTTGGDVTTDGSDGVLAGNVLAPQGATPLQLNNNAAAGAGSAEATDNTSSSDTQSGGAIMTDGTDGVLSGNAAGAPLAVPVEVVNNAGSVIGIAESQGENSATATAGSTQTGLNDIDSYIQTNGDGGVLSGNVAQPQGAGDAAVHGIAGSGIGTASADSTNDTDSKAGAFSSTSGQDSVLGGNLADAPMAAPIEVYCGSGNLFGITDSTCDNTTSADAGSGTYTNGTGGTGGGNSINSPVAVPAEAFGAAATGGGTASAEATEDKVVDAGGYNGSAGDDSTASGNIIQTPVAAPLETFGAGGALGGEASGTATETKDVNSGGDGNSVDDNGTGSSNVIATPVAQPVQAFGLGAAGAGSGYGEGNSDTKTNAGGEYTASGAGGMLSGNIGQVASSAPAQLFGIGGGAVGGEGTGVGDNTSESNAGGTSTTDGADGEGSGNIVTGANSLPLQGHGNGGSVAGEGNGIAYNLTESSAGGTSSTDGTGGSFGGNVVSAPIAGAGGVFGNAAALFGTAAGDGTNDVVSNGGGDTGTAGDSGTVSGNVLSGQALPIAQFFGNGVSVGGVADGLAGNNTEAVSGGDVTTSGVDGSLSGNLFDVPAAAVGQIFGNGLTLGGAANGIADNVTTGSVGGLTTTAGENSSLSGMNDQLPLGGVVQIFNFSAPFLGEALGVSTNTTDISIANGVAQLFAFNGSEMPIDGLPALDRFAAAPVAPLRSERADISPALQPKPISAPAGLPVPAPGLPGAGELPGVGQLPGLGDLPMGIDEVPGVAVPMPAPAMPELGTTLPAPALPAVPARSGVPALPELPAVASVPAVPGVDSLPAVPGVESLPALPG